MNYPDMRWRAFKLGGLLSVLAAAALLQGCGTISSRSVYEGVRSTEKARAVVTDKSRSELPPYDDYEKERKPAGK